MFPSKLYLVAKLISTGSVIEFFCVKNKLTECDITLTKTITSYFSQC
jgi:hypothetical protein